MLSHIQLFATLTRLLCPWDSPGKNPGVGCCALLQGSSWPRDQTGVSCFAGGFFIPEPLGEAQRLWCPPNSLFFPSCLLGPLPLGKTKWLFPSKKKKRKKEKGSCDAGCFPTQAVKNLHGIPTFFLACHGHWQCLGSWALCTQVSEWKPRAESLTLTSLNKHMYSLS